MDDPLMFPMESLAKFDALKPPEGAVIYKPENPIRYLPDMDSVAKAVAERMQERNLTEERVDAEAHVPNGTVEKMLARRPVPVADARDVYRVLSIRTHVYPIEYAMERNRK